MTAFDMDREYLIRTIQELLQLDTVNDPARVSDYRPGIEYLRKKMEDIGFQIQMVGKEGYPNIVGRLQGKGAGKRSIMFNAHLDTVPVGDPDRWDLDPFGGECQDGKIYGRGACDMKGQIGMLLAVSRSLAEKRDQFGGELAVSFVTGHETGSTHGSVWVVENHPESFRADLCLIPEATGGKFSISSRGILWIKLATRGRSGHTATYNEITPDGQGIAPKNAIHSMVRLLNQVICPKRWMTWEPAEHVGRADKMYSDDPIVEVNIIQAGEKQNTVPDLCTAIVDIRFLPTQTPKRIAGELDALIEKMKREDPDLDVAVEVDMIQDPPMHVDRDSQLYRLTARSYQKVFGKTMEDCGVCAPGDAVAFGRLMPVAWIGPLWQNVHGYNECVDVDDLLHYAELYAQIALDYLGGEFESESSKDRK